MLIRNGSRISALCGYLLFALAPMWWTPHHGGPDEYGSHGMLTLVANCYLLAGVVFLAYLANRLPGRRGIRVLVGPPPAKQTPPAKLPAMA